MKQILILIIVLTFYNKAYATTDYLAVNKVTKQLFVFEQEQTKGIFWTTIAGEPLTWEQQDNYYRNIDFTYTNNPYTLDILMHLLLYPVIGLIFFNLINRNISSKKSLYLLVSMITILFGIADLIIYTSDNDYGFVLGIVIIFIGLLMSLPFIILNIFAKTSLRAKE